MCFFIGHSDAPDSIQDRLTELAEELVCHYGVTEFIVGHRGCFDRMATAAVQKVKKRHPEVCAYRLVSYGPDESNVILPEHFNDFYYPLELDQVPKRYAIVRANQIVLRQADYLIAYVRREGGNSGALLRQAKRMEKKSGIRIWNLAERDG